MTDSSEVLVLGATGRQGGAVARHLLLRSRKIRVLTRSPDGAKARALAAQGAQVVGGDLDDRESLVRAMRKAKGVFSVQDPWTSSVAIEIERGKRVGDVAREEGVEHIVYGSVGNAHETTGVPHFESKGTIERHYESLDLSVTAIRPAFFMDSLVHRYDDRARYSLGALRNVLGASGRVQLAAVDDIGKLAADAFDDPASHRGAFDLAGDELTFAEIRATFERVIGSRPRIAPAPLWLLWIFNREGYLNFRWIGEHGWRFDLAAIRAARPDVQSFEGWLRRFGVSPASGVGDR